MSTTLYLIRHGEYENPRQVFHGRLPGFPLSALGRANAAKTSALLATQPLVAVYVSPLTRTVQTGEIIAAPHALSPIPDERLLEIDSVLQGEPLSLVEHELHWNLYHRRILTRGGERLWQVHHRVARFIREKVRQHQGEHFAVVTHGDPIMSVKVKYSGGRLSRASTMVDYVNPTHGLILTFEGTRPPTITPLIHS